jgi:hypothetical protein
MAVILRVLGILDLLTATMLTLYEAGAAPFWLFAPFALDLLAKGILFRDGAASAVDFGVAIYILMAPFLSYWVISVVIAVYLAQKGLLSLL